MNVVTGQTGLSPVSEDQTAVSRRRKAENLSSNLNVKAESDWTELCPFMVDDIEDRCLLFVFRIWLNWCSCFKRVSLMRLFVFGCGHTERGWASCYSSPARVVIFNVATRRSVNLLSVLYDCPATHLCLRDGRQRKPSSANTKTMFSIPTVFHKAVNSRTAKC